MVCTVSVFRVGARRRSALLCARPYLYLQVVYYKTTQLVVTNPTNTTITTSGRIREVEGPTRTWRLFIISNSRRRRATKCLKSVYKVKQGRNINREWANGCQILACCLFSKTFPYVWPNKSSVSDTISDDSVARALSEHFTIPKPRVLAFLCLVTSWACYVCDPSRAYPPL